MDRCLLKAGLCFGEHLCIRGWLSKVPIELFFTRDSRVNASKDRNRMHLEPYYCSVAKKGKKNVFNRTGGVLNFPRYFFSPFFHQKSPFPDFQFHRYRTNNEYRRLITPKKKKKKGEKRKRKKEIGDKITKRFARADFTCW